MKTLQNAAKMAEKMLAWVSFVDGLKNSETADEAAHLPATDAKVKLKLRSQMEVGNTRAQVIEDAQHLWAYDVFLLERVPRTILREHVQAAKEETHQSLLAVLFRDCGQRHRAQVLQAVPVLVLQTRSCCGGQFV
ncbi:hypothetical protein AS149_25445 [Burkholderia cenocepacia]|nr:hypothetical protein AS149_25445 [Burkholderia cenocepacia]